MNSKRILATLLVLCAVCVSAMAQYTPRHSELTQDEWSLSYNKFLSQKNTGIALLSAGGVLSATGIGLYAAGVAGLDRNMGIAGITTFAVAVPFYVAGSILYVRGRRGAFTVRPSGLAFNF